MSLAASAQSFVERLNPRRQTDVENQAARPTGSVHANAVEGSGGGARHEREASGRSVMSNLSDRFASMRQREREHDMLRIQNRFERANVATAGMGGDIEARPQQHTGLGTMSNIGIGLGGAAPGASGMVAGATSTAAPAIGVKSRREKEEGATLFGPNLANYFGTGSSSSGAVAGPNVVAGTLGSTQQTGEGNGINPSANAPVVVPAPAPALPAAPASPISPGPNDGSWGLRGRTRLGSRGRARGASLSGLSNLSLPLDAGESVASLPQQVAAADRSNVDLSNGGEAMAMAEGLEIGTLRRWIERSTAGGAVEIAGPESASVAKGDLGNPSTLCTTLQSYVNLKRNTVRLNVQASSDQQPQPNRAQIAQDSTNTSQVVESPLALRSVTSVGTFTHPLKSIPVPPPTHSLQFEYDCAAPLATVQVFIRASRKHGTWLNWTAMREAHGLPTDLTLEDGNAEEKFLARRGPPPHVLGWPVHSARIKRGFGKPLVANIPLHINYFAPPRPSVSEKETKKDDSLVPETPGLREEAPAVTPAATAAPAADPFFINPTIPAEESKEEKAAREKAERETLKMAIVVEALDEDAKTLKEPNLQMTYLRLSSLPVRKTMQETLQSANDGQVGAGGRDGDAIQDIAPVVESSSEDKEEHLQADGGQAQPEVKRVWSIQVEGQEAEIGPHRFQLQELYGLSSRPPPVRSPDDDDGDHEQENEEGGATQQTALTPVVDFEGSSGGECLICLSSPPTTLLLPCTHGLCLECAVQLRDSVKSTREGERRRGKKPRRKYACPVCRRRKCSSYPLSFVCAAD